MKQNFFGHLALQSLAGGCFLFSPLSAANASIDMGDSGSSSGAATASEPSQPEAKAGSVNTKPVGVATNTNSGPGLMLPTGGGSQILSEQESNNFARLEGLNQQADWHGAIHDSSSINGQMAIDLPASSLQTNSPNQISNKASLLTGPADNNVNDGSSVSPP